MGELTEVIRKRCALGASLLNDALERICRAAEEVAVRAVVVHAINHAAVDFYERFGFRGLSEAPRSLIPRWLSLKKPAMGPIGLLLSRAAPVRIRSGAFGGNRILVPTVAAND